MFLPYECLLSEVVSLLQRVYDLRKLVGLRGLGHLHLQNSQLDVYGVFPSFARRYPLRPSLSQVLSIFLPPIIFEHCKSFLKKMGMVGDSIIVIGTRWGSCLSGINVSLRAVKIDRLIVRGWRAEQAARTKTLQQLGCLETSLLICGALKSSGPPRSRSNTPPVTPSSGEWLQRHRGVCFS